MTAYSLSINGQAQTVDVEDDTPLLWVLRNNLGLTGTKFGCGLAQCGACTVHIDGTATRSCVLPVSEVGSKEITTIEGLAPAEGELHPLQQAWIDNQAPQCGYCQSGQIMSAASLLNRNPTPTDEEILNAMNGNLCRCATYTRIFKAVKQVAGGGE